MDTRAQIRVRGIVQGVGFRPFVFLQATRRALRGHVLNNATGVLIDVEGETTAIEALVEALQSNPPALSRVESIERTDGLPAAHYADFRIVSSLVEGEKSLPVSADIATCDACLRELFDPRNRRYRYPFINCTQCGPRFTIIEHVPYDRAVTTMREFALCRQCRAEYEDPQDRRFHAEPNACPVCGPHLSLTDSTGRRLIRGEDGAAIGQTLELLEQGKLIAIKGIGGLHLACDALNGPAVEQLRQRKFREEKPFAMMARSPEVIERFCALSDDEKKLLHSRQRPIVLLKKRAAAEIPPAVAPGVQTLGFMLPYSPLHHLLFERLDRPLIMTSGNLSDEPIAYRDREAIERLGTIADYFLLHDRRIHMRADDSVSRVQSGQPSILRRSRGYAPESIRTPFEFAHPLLACGGQLKNTFCLGKHGYAFISHHIGDLENFETLSSWAEGIEHFKRLFDIHPQVVAYDLHPDYLSTRYALGLDDTLKIGVQHHHAHIAACMAENGVTAPVIGVAFDGSGFGEDHTIWGGEFLLADLADYRRRAHLRYIPLAGGDSAVRQPWRVAAAYLEDALASGPRALELPGWERIPDAKLDLIRSMIERGVNTARTSSCGRLFDAVSSLLAVRHEASYEGQAAIELEGIAFDGINAAYPFDVDDQSVSEIDLRPAIRNIVDDIHARAPAGLISAKFHNTVAAIIIEVCARLRAREGIDRVCLSGGVFQNQILLDRARNGLRRRGFQVFSQNRIPTNDGGLAFGQAAVANARIRRGGA